MKKNDKAYNTTIPAIRTYKTDIAETVKNSGETLSSIVLKEKIKKRKQEPSPQDDNKTKRSGVVFNTLGVVVLIAGIVMASVLLVKEKLFPILQKKTTEGVEQVTTSVGIPQNQILVNKGDVVAVDFNSSEANTILDNLYKKPVGDLQVKVLYFYEEANTTDGEEATQKNVPISSRRFIQRFFSAPPDFIRSLGEKFSVGIYTEDDQFYPFIVFEIEDFSRAFAGMLKWEETLAYDFRRVFGLQTIKAYTFVDTTIGQTDARVALDANKTPLVAYSFANNNTLILTTAPEALKALPIKTK